MKKLFDRKRIQMFGLPDVATLAVLSELHVADEDVGEDGAETFSNILF